jgi:hypothetical protein
MTAGASFRDQVFRECLTAFPEVTFTVTGECMRPDLVPGERVRVVGLAVMRPRLGDVVLTRRGDAMRLHRLVWRPPLAGSRVAWRTKADRARFLDPAFTEGDVIGTVVAVEGRPYGRRPARALGSLFSAAVVRLRSAFLKARP